ncbi:hypothetical protein PMAYCL1PPCAC_24650, partial [Pristionchus mayeri]
ASVASSYGSSDLQLMQQLQKLELQQQARVHSRTALPSLTNLRMQPPTSLADLSAVTSAAAAAAQPHAFSVSSGRSSSMSSSASSIRSDSSASTNGFWKNPILYKTTICDNWSAKKPCKYGARCWYAHGFNELRFVPRLDQLPDKVREALFVEPALARAFFHEMTSSMDAGYSSSSSTRECESRASLVSLTSSSSSSVDSCRLSMSPSTTSDAVSSPPNELEAVLQLSPPASSYLADRRANRWAPGSAWTDGCETPRASGRSAPSTTVPHSTAPSAKPRVGTSEYRLFDGGHPLAIDLSFLRE